MGKYSEVSDAGTSSHTVNTTSNNEGLSEFVVEPDTHGEVLDVEETTVDDIVSRGIQQYPYYWSIGERERRGDDTAHILTVRATDPETGQVEEYELVLGFTDGTGAEHHDTQFERINEYFDGACDGPVDLQGKDIPLRFVSQDGYHVAIDPLDFDRWLLDNGYKYYDESDGCFRVSTGAWAGNSLSKVISIVISVSGVIGVGVAFDFITLETEVGTIISLLVLLAAVIAPIIIHHGIQKHVIKHVV